ncbi:MAG: phosphate/phosphite/phosphonate ABC transporter substrate-binding protein [Myxacorys chilensis ATA2-1-KO14]|jgi:phosphonate transport system substrate-binding protein|nr:phosphate/phosphite/phosphonate ABC transporter substrate-binding protein [Myxacorys chilensis ATA2-1-KO14]
MKLNRTTSFSLSAALLALTTAFLSACNTQPSSNQAAAPQGQTTAPQGQTATNATLDQLRVVFPSRSGATEVQTKANAITTLLSKELNMPVTAVVGDDTAAVEALKAEQAEVAFLSSRPALKAEQLANSRLYLAEVRPDYSGGHTYRSVFVVRNDSPLQSKDDPKQNLEQLRGKKIAFTSPTSGSGFIFPVGDLVKQGLVENRDRVKEFFGEVTYGNNYSGALQAVLKGQADVAAVSEYALKDPYITPEESKQVRILHAISGVPAHGVAIDDRVSADLRGRLVSALQKLNEPANNALLKDLYNSTELVNIDHTSHLAPMQTALKQAGMEP